MRPDPLGSRTGTVRLVLDGDDPYYQVPNPWHPQFYVVPVSMEAEFSLDERDPLAALRRVRITGQRYRIMADGTIKAVGPGRGPAAAQHRLPPRPWE